MINEDEFIEYMGRDFPNLKVTRNDLSQPTRPFIMQYYSTLLEQVMRMSIRNICSFTDEQLVFLQSQGDGVSLHDHVTSYNLYMAVKYIFDKIELFTSEFHYSDILCPFLTPKRSFVFMTTLYHFYASCAEFDEYYEQVDFVEAKNYEISQLKQEQAKLKEQILINNENKKMYIERVKDIKKQLSELSVCHQKQELNLKELQEREQVCLEELSLLDEEEKKLQEQFLKVENEKNYYASLIVSDDSQITETHGKLTAKKDECFSKLRNLEKQVHDGCSKVSQLETVLSLYDALNQALRGPFAVGNKTFELKGLHNSTLALKKEAYVLEKEEKELSLRVKEKEDALPGHSNELERQDLELSSITSTWKEKQGNYKSLLLNLQRSLSEFSHRALIEEAGLTSTFRKIEELAVLISTKEDEIRAIDKECKDGVAQFEMNLISALRQIIAQASAYKTAHGVI